MMMLAYSAALTLALLLSAPWWLLRMATTDRYREGLRQRLGRVPAHLRSTGAGAGAGAPHLDSEMWAATNSTASRPRTLWLHTVSVGEVLAATRLVAGLEAALPGHRIVISTTTRTGQALARARFAADSSGAPRVFYFPLDFAFAVRAWLNALQPEALLLMESELWPRMLDECARRNILVAVVNARVSDRSLRRTLRFRKLWQRMAAHVTLWLAQSEQDAQRLAALGAQNVRAIGNLKYDLREGGENAMTSRIAQLRGSSRLIVAGSTLENEEEMLMGAWPQVLRGGPDMVLLLAPRHPERFKDVLNLIQRSGFTAVLCSDLSETKGKLAGGSILLLDTIGDLASVYAVASAAFIGGSLVPRGGHNPLEAARFGVPIIMGESFENFREIVDGMKDAGAIRIIKEHQLAEALMDAPQHGQQEGQRGLEFYQSRAGATARAVAAILELLTQDLLPQNSTNSKLETEQNLSQPAAAKSPAPAPSSNLKPSLLLPQQGPAPRSTPPDAPPATGGPQ